MVTFAGLLLVCWLGFVAAGDEPLMPSHFQTHHHSHGPVTTVCIQVRGTPGELCGPVVPPPDSKDPEMVGSRSSDMNSGLIQMDQLRSVQGNEWLGQQSNPSMPLRSAVLQGFIGNGPVYQMEPGRAAETLPPIVRVNSFAPPPPMNLMRAQEPPPNQQPCVDQAPRFSGPPQQVMMAPPPDSPPGHFFSSSPQLRTLPFAPFGFEQPPVPQTGPQPQFAMRQAYMVPARASNAQFMSASRSSDCLENEQQSATAMRASSSSSESNLQQQQQQDMKALSKQCAQQEKELQEKKLEIGELKKQLENMSQAAKQLATPEEKTITTKSSQAQTMEKEQKQSEKDMDDTPKITSDMVSKKKRK